MGMFVTLVNKCASVRSGPISADAAYIKIIFIQKIQLLLILRFVFSINAKENHYNNYPIYLLRININYLVTFGNN